jgi:hypothetical protein
MDYQLFADDSFDNEIYTVAGYVVPANVRGNI